MVSSPIRFSPAFLFFEMLRPCLYTSIEHFSERLSSTEIRLARDARAVPLVQQGAIDTDHRDGFSVMHVILSKLNRYFAARDDRPGWASQRRRGRGRHTAPPLNMPLHLLVLPMISP